jgi:hypothetical protein
MHSQLPRCWLWLVARHFCRLEALPEQRLAAVAAQQVNTTQRRSSVYVSALLTNA